MTLGVTESKGKRALRIWRIRDTGEVLGDDAVDPGLVPFNAGPEVACSPSRCAIVTPAKTPGTTKQHLQVAIFDPRAKGLAFALSSTEIGSFARPVFDGEHFLVLSEQGEDFAVARIEGETPPTTLAALEGERPVLHAAPGGGDVVLFATRPRSVSDPPRVIQGISVWSVRGEGFVEATGSGAGGGGGTPAPQAANGCGCSDAGAAPDAFAALVTAAALAAALRRRRAEVHAPR